MLTLHEVIMSRFRYLQVDDGRVIVDDGFVPRADFVEVLEDAAQHQAESTVDTQSHGHFDQRLEDAPHGLVDDAVHAVDEPLDDLSVVRAVFVTFGKGDVDLCDRLLQVLEQ